MFSFLKGIIEAKGNNIISLDVNGVGYETLVSNETLSAVGNVGDNVKLLTYMVVRENEVFLIGFRTAEEKSLFLNLITVNGVGPKTALQILSGSSCANILTAIVTGDVTSISNVKGIGKKTAERIILELKEKFVKENGTLDNLNKSTVFDSNNSIISDAVLALTSLGLSKQEAEMAVRNEYKDGIMLEDLISKALRRI